VAIPEQLTKAIDRTIKIHSRLDCLISSAGYHLRKRPKLTLLTSEGELGLHLEALWTLSPDYS